VFLKQKQASDVSKNAVKSLVTGNLPVKIFKN